jgi:hypothetical protein
LVKEEFRVIEALLEIRACRASEETVATPATLEKPLVARLQPFVTISL